MCDSLNNQLSTNTDCKKPYNKLGKGCSKKVLSNLWETIGFCLHEALEKLLTIGGLSIFEIRKARLTVISLHEKIEKFGRSDPIFDAETAECYEIALRKKNFIKIKNDRAFLEKFLDRLAKDVILNKSYKILEKFTNDRDKYDKDEMELLCQQKHNSLQYRVLDLRRQHEYNKELKKVQILSESIRKYDDEFGLQLIQNEISTIYMEQREKAVTENTLLKHSSEESKIEKIIKKYKFESEKELRAHFDIIIHLKQSETDINREVEQWKEKCDAEFERLQKELDVISEKLKEQKNKFENVSIKYAKRKNEVEEYLLHEEKKRKIAEEQTKLNAMATKIQAWWRGLMVRLQLGPYNPKKGKRSKAKGNKNRSEKTVKSN